MSVRPVRTDPGLYYSQEVYMIQTMQHDVEHNTYMHIHTGQHIGQTEMQNNA